jgi:hypothetical protein
MKQLTKNQIKKDVEEIVDFFGTKFNGVLRKSILMFFLFLFNVTETTPGIITNGGGISSISKDKQYVKMVKEKINNELTIEVDKYIKSIAPESKLSSEFLVKKCLEYNVDIVFVLAQGLLESHFGTKGLSATTNSVWNVGTYDDGQILYSYESPDESLDPYLKLLNERYLINITPNGDTIYKDISHLTQDKGYINDDGKRYATAEGYENALRKLMINIDSKTSIKFYQGILILPDDKLLTYFKPIELNINPNEYLASN